MPAPPASSRTPIIIGAVAIVLVVAIGFLAYRALYGGTRHESVAVAEPPKSTEPPKVTEAPDAAAKVEPAKDVAAAAPAQESAASAPATQSAPVDEAPKASAASPPRAQDGSATKAPRSAQSKAASKTDTPATEPTPAPAPPAKAAPKAAVAAAATAPAVVQRDYWEQYAEAVALCKREDFFKRIGCELRTRNQYCQGYWGQVPQCPEATPRDRGQ